MHQSPRVLRSSETLRGTRGRGNESTLKTGKVDYQLRRGGVLLIAITDVDLDIFIVATVMSFISDMTCQSCWSERRMVQRCGILESQRKPSTPL